MHSANGLRPWAQRLARWLLMAMCLATLAPAVSRVLVSGPPGDGQEWVELCTSQGMQWVRVAELGPSRSDRSAPADSGPLDRCGHCTLAAERFAPLLPSIPTLTTSALPWASPHFFGVETLSAELPRAHARGPPHLS